MNHILFHSRWLNNLIIKKKKKEKRILHAANNGGKNSGECLAAICLSVSNKNTSVPENESP